MVLYRNSGEIKGVIKNVNVREGYKIRKNEKRK
jgi:hypothetical protein